jgi:hypothetical protein
LTNGNFVRSVPVNALCSEGPLIPDQPFMQRAASGGAAPL